MAKGSPRQQQRNDGPSGPEASQYKADGSSHIVEQLQKHDSGALDQNRAGAQASGSLDHLAQRCALSTPQLLEKARPVARGERIRPLVVLIWPRPAVHPTDNHHTGAQRAADLGVAATYATAQTSGHAHPLGNVPQHVLAHGEQDRLGSMVAFPHQVAGTRCHRLPLLLLPHDSSLSPLSWG
jgi:hypothetical protein